MLGVGELVGEWQEVGELVGEWGGWWQEGQTTSLSQATEMSRGDMFVLDWDSHADKNV